MGKLSFSALLIIISSISSFSQPVIANITDTGEKKEPERRGLTRIASFLVRPKKPLTRSAPDLRPPPGEVPDLPRPPVVTGKPLCTWVMPRAVRIGGFLGACEGDVVTLMEAENLPDGQAIASNFCTNCGEAGRQGRVLVTTLELNQHTGNVYLEIADFLVAHPPILAALIVRINKEESDAQRLELLDRLVNVFAARRVLGRALEGLFLLELEGFVQPNELFREDTTPAMTLVRTILRREGQMREFRCSLVRDMENAAEGYVRSSDVRAIIDALNSCQETLVHLPNRSLPKEMSLILGSLKKALQRFLPTQAAREKGLFEEHIPLLLGSLLYLRVLSPTITQPQLYLRHVPDNVARAMLTIGQAMQLVGNRVDPAEDRPLFAIAAQLRVLHECPTAIVNRILALPFPWFDVEGSQIANAALFYRQVVDLAEQLIRQGLLSVEEFQQLKLRLGIVPRLDLLCDEDVPRINEIREIQKTLRKMLPKQLPL